MALRKSSKEVAGTDTADDLQSKRRKRRDEGSGFEEFYKESFEHVYASVLLFCGDRDLAVDSTQEAFSRALARWGRLRSDPWIEGWVVTTAFNVSRRHVSRQVLLDRLLARSGPHEKRSSEADPGQRLDLIQALRRLPPRRREAAVLHYIVDHPVAVVARTMDLSEGAVKAHLSLARKDLSKLMAMTNQVDSHGGEVNG